MELDETPCRCGHPRYQHLNHGDWCKGGGWHDRHGAPCPCSRFAVVVRVGTGGGETGE